MRKLAFSALVLFGCSVPLKQKAHIVAQSSKEIIDVEYSAWDSAANDRISECEKKLSPPEDYTKSDYDECVGPYNEKVQQKIVTGLEAVRAAQLGLFIVLAQDLSNQEVQQALLDLTSAVADFIKLVQENK